MRGLPLIYCRINYPRPVNQIMANNNCYAIQQRRTILPVKRRSLTTLSRCIKVFFVSSIIGNAAFAQTEKGTIGVVYFTQDQISAAIDSRIISEDSPPLDTECKLITFNNEIVFLSSGVTHHAHPGFYWDTREEAKRAYSTIATQPTIEDGRAAQMAAFWASSSLDSFIRWNQEEPVSLQRNITYGALVAAFFGGFDGSGRLVLWEARIIYDARYPNPIDRHVKKILECKRNICALGRAELVAELIYGDSESARTEALEWEKIASLIPQKDRPIQIVVRLVELTIKKRNATGLNDVGGPIDAVELRKDASIHWYASKVNCKQN